MSKTLRTYQLALFDDSVKWPLNDPSSQVGLAIAYDFTCLTHLRSKWDVYYLK